MIDSWSQGIKNDAAVIRQIGHEVSTHVWHDIDDDWTNHKGTLVVKQAVSLAAGAALGVAMKHSPVLAGSVLGLVGLFQFADAACALGSVAQESWSADSVNKRQYLARRVGGEVARDIANALETTPALFVGGATGTIVGRRVGVLGELAELSPSRGAGRLFNRVNPSLANRTADVLRADVAYGFDRSAFLKTVAGDGIEGIKTKHPDRFLIRMDGYHFDPGTAAKAEQLIGATREQIKAKAFVTEEAMDDYVAGNYLNTMYPTWIEGRQASQINRIDATGVGSRYALDLFGKHEPYAPRMEALLDRPDSMGGINVRVNHVSLYGREVEFGKVSWYPGDNSPDLYMPESKQALDLAQTRMNELFLKFRDDTPLPGKIDPAKVSDLAEYEWLGARRYKQFKGVAGITQVKVRAILEAQGYDSSRYKLGLDPNLEALTTDLDTFKQNYDSFFAVPLGSTRLR